MHGPLMFFLVGIITWYHGVIFGLLVIFFVIFFLWRFGVRWSAALVITSLLFFFFGIFLSFQLEKQQELFLGSVTRYSVFSGVVASEPTYVSGLQKVKIDIANFPQKGRITALVSPYISIWRGQSIAVEGKVQIREVYGKKEAMLSSAKVLDVREGRGFLSFVSRIRRYFVLRMQQLFPGSVGGFLVGILAGGSSGLNERVVTDFRRTGLTHIIAVSGSNVTILLQFLAVVFAFVSRQYRFLVLGFFVLFFVVFVGFEPSAVRAGWMGFLGLLALSFGRVKHMTLMILWSAFFMLAYDPSLLLDDRGFQLSFLATVGVTYFSPIFARWMEQSSVRRVTGDGLIEALSATVSVFLLTFPVMASFHAFPLIGLITNLIFVAAIPVAMLLAVVIFSLSYLSFPIAYFFARIVSVFADLYFSAIHFFSSLPFAVISISPMTKYAVAVYYVFLLFLLKKFMSRPEA